MIKEVKEVLPSIQEGKMRDDGAETCKTQPIVQRHCHIEVNFAIIFVFIIVNVIGLRIQNPMNNVFFTVGVIHAVTHQGKPFGIK